jgi:hypothetical protein
MADVPIPAALARAGIVARSDNLPAGSSLDIAAEFVRVFRAEIEARLSGLPDRRAIRAAVPSRPAP